MKEQSSQGEKNRASPHTHIDFHLLVEVVAEHKPVPAPKEERQTDEWGETTKRCVRAQALRHAETVRLHRVSCAVVVGAPACCVGGWGTHRERDRESSVAVVVMGQRCTIHTHIYIIYTDTHTERERENAYNHKSTPREGSDSFFLCRLTDCELTVN